MNRPETQLFLLMSLDGKISTGASDDFDFDIDLPKIPGVAEGLGQYYDLEKETDQWSLVTGRVISKIFETAPLPKEPLDVTQVVVSSSHLTYASVDWLSKKYKQVIIVDSTLNMRPIRGFQNVKYMYYNTGDLKSMLTLLRSNYGCEKLTIQSGGQFNFRLFKQGLIDHINLVVAPIIVGGKNTPTIVDGFGCQSLDDIQNMTTLKRAEVRCLDHNYLQLKYDVIRL